VAELTDAQRAFIRDNAYYAVLTTLREDGSPHSSVVWVTEEDGKVLVNTVERRVKGRNLARDPRASVVVFAPDGYHWIAVDGHVELSVEGAMDDIDALSQKYDGQPFRELEEGEHRITARITPERITTYGL
jgi:PPOX class probable F420-dependent enzyme